MLGTTHGVLPCVDTTGESEVGPNSIIKLSEVVRDTKIAAESDSTLLETQVLSIGCVAMVKAQGAADVRPAKQIEVVDDMGLIDCNIVNGLDERSSFLLGENSAIDGLGESSGASLGDSMEDNGGKKQGIEVLDVNRAGLLVLMILSMLFFIWVLRRLQARTVFMLFSFKSFHARTVFMLFSFQFCEPFCL
ncbi:hypothetical protein ACOSP7_009060 [Xanthoceras sorbifolium]